MSLSDEERQTLVRMELQKAREAYEDIVRCRSSVDCDNARIASFSRHGR